jgi:hypothetical protein
MGFDGNGKWTSNFYPISDRDNEVAILASKFQNLIQNDIKSGFDNCILRDGTGRPTSNINWNGYKITNLAAGTGATDAVNKEQMDNAIATDLGTRALTDLSNLTQDGKDLLVPVGCLQMAPLTSLTGYLLCDGSAVSRATYANLFSVIGVNFGVGDGVTTFNVPDYRGCFLRGLGGDSAANMYTKQPMGAPNITGTFPAVFEYDGGWNNVSPTGAFYYENQTGPENSGSGSSTSNDRRFAFSGSRSNSVYGAANEIRPVNYAVNIFIKY